MPLLEHLTPRRELFGGGRQHAAERAERVDQPLGERLGVAARNAEEEQHFQHFVVGEALGATHEKAVAHAAAMALRTRALERHVLKCGRRVPQAIGSALSRRRTLERSVAVRNDLE